jgi:CheY-like chemotaxis protein/signal transduction histidine kinase
LRTTFKAKLIAIFGAALFALLSVSLISALMSLRQNRELDEVQSRLVPKAELAPRIESELERLTRGLQDAVSAQDLAALEATAERKTALFELIARAGPALDPAAAAALRWTVQDYYDSARDVSRRMIVGETGDALTQDLARMQARQSKAVSLVKRTTSLDRDELARAFGAVRGTNQSADRFRLAVTALGTGLVALLALWGSRGTLQALANLSSGLARFGTGDFRAPIPVTTRDELAAVATEANQMAASLLKLSLEREDETWLKAGIAGLSDELRGELAPEMVAQRALDYLAPRVGALAAAFYVRHDDTSLRLSATYATDARIVDVAAAPRFAEGEGLVGRALANGELSVVSDLPEGYLPIRSGLGQAAARELLLVPLVHHGRKAGVLELALLTPTREVARELLLSVRPMLVVAIEAARAAAARQSLLAETQAQAERLMAQEEELRLNNQELVAQQEELRRANEELHAQRLELSQQNAELDRAGTVLEQKAAELAQMSSYKSQFLANMSHELRTPLNSMLLLSHLLSENEAGNLSAKQIEHLKTIHGAGQDLLGLINEVLDLSKIEAGKQEVALEGVELRHFLSFARRLFEASAAQKGVTLVTELEPSAPLSLVTDRLRVERILTNLLSNALKFTQQGQVSLRIGWHGASAGSEDSEKSLAFTVSDTGIGIPPASRERVFAPFEQVQGQANRGYGGTGLGLSIARESARLLGGDLVLQHTSERGSTFVCTLPAAVRLPTDSTLVAASGVRVDDDALSLGAEEHFLLIVEDDPVLAEQLVEIAHARGLRVRVAASGREGLDIARRGKVLGIVLDVKLPDVDGWGVMDELKRHESTREIPVHFVSGVDAAQRGLALGAVGYLVKPASHADLARMLRTLVPTKPSPQRILVAEDDAKHGASVLSLLERNGMEATHVQTAHAALEALAGGQFGCMILDLGLPDMDGLGLLETLRQRPELGSPRILIHTGRALSRKEARELEAYAEAVVLKDGSSSERLLEEVRLFVHHLKAKAVVSTPPAPPRADPSLRGIKLLLAEDDIRTVYSLSALLRSRGADVVTAETGREALEALGQHADVRCVLMDVMMPEMDGYEAMRRLRSDDRFVNLPVIALTAKAMPGERERCVEAGATDYLAKPIDGEKLLSALQRLVAGGGA